MSLGTGVVSFAMLLAGAAHGQQLDVGGSCPGVVDLVATDLTPSGRFVLLTGALGGSSAVPGGGCAGTPIDLGSPTPRAALKADAAGTRSMSPTLPASACALGVQVMDLTTCATSPAVPLTGMPEECVPGSGIVPTELTESVVSGLLTLGEHLDPSCENDDEYNLYGEHVYTLQVDTQLETLTIDNSLAGESNITIAVWTECQDPASELGCEYSHLGQPLILTDVAPGSYDIIVDGRTTPEYELTITGDIADAGACDPASTLLVCGSGYLCDAGVGACRLTACNDGVDNDGDLHVDFDPSGGEPGCTGVDDDDESDACPGAGCPACADGTDDDGDGLVDLDDPMCVHPSDDDEFCDVFGSDAFGYTGCAEDLSSFIAAGGGPVWCPIPVGGTAVMGTVATATLPFTFDWYGTPMTEVDVAYFGWLGFPSSLPDFFELECIPHDDHTNRLAVWVDSALDTDEGNVTYGTVNLAGTDVFAVRWNVGDCGGDRIDVRAVLHPTGDIDVCYLDTTFEPLCDPEWETNHGAQGVSGLQGPTLDEHLQHHCQSHDLYEGLVLHYFHP